MPEHIGVLKTETYVEATDNNGVTFDAGATVIGDLSANPAAEPDPSDGIGADGSSGITGYTLWYGGFDVGTDTNIGSPSASINFNGRIRLVPEPSSALLIIAGIAFFGFRRKRK